MPESLLERFGAGDRRALSQLLSRIAREEASFAVLGRLPVPTRPGRVVALTGSGGVGKSTLVGKLIEVIRSQGLKVAVLACDPQSPVSGGALLGDRFRMPVRPDDDGVFIRSLAAASGRGAVALHLDAMIRLLEAFGFDVILVETVGAGQGDTAVHELADVLVLLVQPETGDDLQWEKAGLLEVADIVAIHKADLQGAEHVESRLRAILSLSDGPAIPVLQASSKTGKGIDELWSKIAAVPLRRAQLAHDGPGLLNAAQHALAGWFREARSRNDPALQCLLDQWSRGAIAEEDAARSLLQLAQAPDTGGNREQSA